jgi:predicted site-specific integrase-resolvase
MDDQLLSVKEFGRRLGGISPATIATWLSTGRFGLQRVKIGRRTMLREEDLSKVIEASKNSPTPRARKPELKVG